MYNIDILMLANSYFLINTKLKRLNKLINNIKKERAKLVVCANIYF